MTTEAVPEDEGTLVPDEREGTAPTDAPPPDIEGPVVEADEDEKTSRAEDPPGVPFDGTEESRAEVFKASSKGRPPE